MEHKGTQTLKTKRLTLRRFSYEDIEPSFNNWTNDEEVCKFLRWKPHGDIELTTKVLTSWIELYENKKFYQWAIVLDETNQVIGTISVVELKEHIDTVHIGYCIGRDFWNKGYASEAFSSVIDYFFNEVKVNRIETQHDPLNIGSKKVMEKCGLKFEGGLRQADTNNTGVVDAVMHSILKSEYNQ